MQRRFVEGRDREVCPACGFIFYRNPLPAVGVVVALDDAVVLVRRRYAPQVGHWALPAGYMELGESAEEAAIRECHEETGLLVQIDHLLGVYSFGNREQSGIIIIYAATAVGGTLQANDDALEAAAFAVDALPEPFAFRSHLQAIERWRQRRWSSSLPLETSGRVRIRYASQADAVQALNLVLPEAGTGSERWQIADALFHDRLHAPDHPTLLAEHDTMVVGVAALSFHQRLSGWYATLDELVVAPDQRRHGVGAALVAAAVQLARARGCAILLAIAPPDAASRDFLAAQGFASGAVWSLPLNG